MVMLELNAKCSISVLEVLMENLSTIVSSVLMEQYSTRDIFFNIVYID